MKTTSPSLPDAAIRALDEFYFGYGSTTTEQKIKAMKTVLGDDYQFYGTGGSVPLEGQLACLELEWLMQQQLIELELL